MLMKRMIDRIQKNSLFFKMFFIMMASIVSVAIFITYSTIHMSKQFFMNTFSITNHKVMKQIKDNFETFSYSVVLATNSIQQSGTIKNILTQEDANAVTLAKSYYKMEDQLKRIHSHFGAFNANMTVTGENGHLFTINDSYWPFSFTDLNHHSITTWTHQKPDQIIYQYLPATREKKQPYIIAAKALSDSVTGNIYGTLYISTKESDFKKFYENDTSDGNDFLIADRNGIIISSNQQKWIGQKAAHLLAIAKELENNQQEYENATVFGENKMVLAEYLPSFDMYLINVIGMERITDNIVHTKSIVIISFSIVAIALFVVFFISRGLTKSLSNLVRQISKVAKNDFHPYVEVSGGYETRQLAETFNYMLKELHQYVNKLITTEKKQRNAELEALQQQINPHFLYNTLASIKIMVQQGKKTEPIETIHALISLLQNAIGDISDTITVEKEISNLKNYAYINQIRYGDRIKVYYFISPDCLTFHLPKLIIQPFIENAFFHAFNRKKEGFIQIMIAQKENCLSCEIIDNGDGMEWDGRNAANPGIRQRHLFSGIGIRNVHERIQLLYGNDYGVEIASQLGMGTKVTILLPLLK
ncbi:sensor histidine kinase [Bacillaceae bacterium Marseille-Q3522]|nr:sensor histidine kinase [Bacillaceae bacterium Marseille-Q3522]